MQHLFSKYRKGDVELNRQGASKKQVILPFSTGSIEGVKVSIRLEVMHHEILDFDTGTNFFTDHIT